MNSEEKMELRSEEVQEILGTPPRWIVRWGVTIILLVVIILFTGSYLFKYPDAINSRVTILSESPPVQIVAKSSGKLDQLFVQNNQVIQEEEILGVIENTADYHDAYSILAQLDTLRSWFNTPERWGTITFSEDYSLGQYQSYYSSFVSQLRNYQAFHAFNPYDQRIRSLQKQVQDYRNFFEKLRDQINVLRQDFELAHHQYARDSALSRQQFLSELEVEKSKATMLKQKIAYQDAMAGLAQTQITMNNLQEQVREQEVLKAEAGVQLLAALKERYDILMNQLKEWEHSFILKSPINGQVTFTSFWSPNQFVSSGNVVFTVVPRQEQKIIGRATVPVSGAGKIEPGQRVNIKLDNYPHLEYGMVEGQVVNISMVPVVTAEGAFYTVEIALVNDLMTNYNRNLAFSQEMQGVAEIITRDRRLIERLAEPLVSVLRERL